MLIQLRKIEFFQHQWVLIKRYQTLRNKTVGTFRELPRRCSYPCTFQQAQKKRRSMRRFFVCGELPATASPTVVTAVTVMITATTIPIPTPAAVPVPAPAIVVVPATAFVVAWRWLVVARRRVVTRSRLVVTRGRLVIARGRVVGAATAVIRAASVVVRGSG